jgi:cytochrome oxidase Cu insertion factor (SCO1/SenC/PrrC family)
LKINNEQKGGKIMQGTEVEKRFLNLDESEKSDNYNFEHFKTKILLHDVQRTIEARGIEPGAIAPDFELPQVGGDSFRLSDLRGKPTILHFGSYS